MQAAQQITAWILVMRVKSANNGACVGGSIVTASASRLSERMTCEHVFVILGVTSTHFCLSRQQLNSLYWPCLCAP